MTREEQIIILTNAQERAFKQIDLTEGFEMGTEDFARLIHAAEQLRWMTMPPETTVPDEVQNTSEPAEIVPDKVQSEPGISKEELRDKLSTYSNRYDSLDVAKIMSEMGYSRLSEIPATKYAELLAKVEAAVKEGA